MRVRFLLSGLISLIILCSQPCTAQDADGLDSPATFRGGGMNTFNDWVFKKLFFASDDFIDLGEEGIVTVRFTVDKKGKIKDLSLVSAYDEKLAEKVIATIKKAPAWTPAMKNGEPVDTEMTTDIELMYDLITNSYHPEPKQTSDSLKSLEMGPDSHMPYFKVKNDEDQFRDWVGTQLIKNNGNSTDDISGTIELIFVINKGGYIEDVIILKSSRPKAIRMVMNILYNCPKWCSAGYHEGKYVNVRYTLPIIIKMPYVR